MHIKIIPLVISIIYLCFSNHAIACSGPSYEGKEAFHNATRVIRVKIISTELVKEKFEGDDFEIVNAKVKLLETFKGKFDTQEFLKTSPFAPGNCMLPLLTGSEYVIYLGENNMVFDFNGSWSYLDSDNKGTAQELVKIRNYAK